jgi:hypothetical protein
MVRTARSFDGLPIKLAKAISLRADAMIKSTVSMSVRQPFRLKVTLKLPRPAYPSAQFSSLVQTVSILNSVGNASITGFSRFSTISTKTVDNFVDNSSPIHRMPATGLAFSELLVSYAMCSARIRDVNKVLSLKPTFR